MSDEHEHLPPPIRPARRVNRREALGTLAACLAGGPVAAAAPPAQFRLATFSADVTPPLGHALMGGGIAPAREVLDPLSARGFVLLGVGRPVVLAAIDWCEIRNDAFDRWREALAEAADTEPRRVLVTSLHQHDAPIADLAAQRLLDARHAAGQHLRPRLPRAGRAGRGHGGPRGPEVGPARDPRRDRPGEGREGRVEPPLRPGGRQARVRPPERHPRPRDPRRSPRG